MKLLTFMKKDNLRLGVQADQGIVDIAAARSETQEQNIPTDIMEVIEGGPAAITTLEKFPPSARPQQ